MQLPGVPGLAFEIWDAANDRQSRITNTTALLQQRSWFAVVIPVPVAVQFFGRDDDGGGDFVVGFEREQADALGGAASRGLKRGTGSTWVYRLRGIATLEPLWPRADVYQNVRTGRSLTLQTGHMADTFSLSGKFLFLLCGSGQACPEPQNACFGQPGLLSGTSLHRLLSKPISGRSAK